MARRRGRNLLVPQASQAVERFKGEVMQRKGYSVNMNEPGNVKYEVAQSLGIPLTTGRNGHLSTEQAGKIGGQIGGSMVREMILLAQQQLMNNNQNK
ncbi:alpha/beta-type small acid-soluble spore protein [Paenibacillus sp. WQ 127069]|uniref:Alpha/beta-type small acid-soluble spore protein n=1 Tax=Paenibacillus baimaensis TaxID=2982185 RepID=A0ABT2UBV1_9BACL|nr:alpha/beta-type small acid-soluble spore protein [Paenibacillus sp. WQ 127069]MCU6792110.1 alpha/beta-type small acid-soluble spore protein [Paenibacillus sp. WQ 127069]